MKTPHQRHVMKSAAAAVITVALAALFVFSTPPWAVTRSVPLHAVWAYAMIFNGLWLPLLIGVRANQRFLDCNQIEGQLPPPDTGSAIDARVLQNTLEQTVFALIATGLLAMSHAAFAAMLLFMHALLFSVGRALFWYGYHRRPIARAYGFALTFYSTAAIYLYATIGLFSTLN